MFGISNKFIIIISVAVVIAVTIDTSLASISLFTGELSSTSYSYELFFVLIMVYGIGQFLILRYVRFKLMKFKKNRALVYLNKVIFVIQYVLLIINTIILIQILIFESYALILLRSLIWINYIFAGMAFGFLGIRLFLWDRLNRDYVLLLFAISALSLSISSITTILFINDQLKGQRGFEYVFPMRSPQAYLESVYSPFVTIYSTTYIFSFILTWISTIFLLRHYSNRIGKTKYWIMVFVPLIYFLSQYQSYIPDLFVDFRNSDPISYGISYTLFFNLSKPIGGVLFGLVFWSIAISITKSAVRDYMILSGFGIMLFFTVNQPIFVTLFPFPPFGVITICFIGLSSYLVLIGVYSSAISIASDSELYKLVRRTIRTDPNFLHQIGGAEEMRQIRLKALNITNELSNKIQNETGISSYVDEQDIKEYLNELLSEFDKKK